MMILAVTATFLIPARAETQAQPEQQKLQAAQELVTTSRFADQFKAIMPTILKNMKNTIVQNRPDIERDYDALTPVLLDGMTQRVGELQEAVAIIYATNFSIDEMKAATAFYKTPVGQSYLSKAVKVGEQTMAAGQQFGKMVGAEAQKKMIEGLRKKGHAI